MKPWEQAEFEAQQEAIKKWAEKKLFKICNGKKNIWQNKLFCVREKAVGWY